MKKKVYVFISCILAMLIIVGTIVVVIDPFMHYHKPLEGWYYLVDNQRAQSDGIVRNFEYDCVVMGTSLTEGFSTNLVDEKLGTNSIKVPMSGATFYDTYNLMNAAFESDNDIRYIIRSLDINHLYDDKDALRNDLGVYPTYLYDKNILNDVNYLFNKDVILNYCIPEIAHRLHGRYDGGIDFNSLYRVEHDQEITGLRWIMSKRGPYIAPEEAPQPLNEDELNTFIDNVNQNIFSVADAHPGTTFIYFIPPFSALSWAGFMEDGSILKNIECEERFMKMSLEHPNVWVYCMANDYDIIENYAYYKDYVHYTSLINDRIIEQISENQFRVTEDNIDKYISEQRSLFLNYDYEQFNNQDIWD